MHKIFQTALVLLLIAGFTLLLKPGQKPEDVDKSSFVAVSADSAIIAGNRQDFVIYVLNPAGKAPSPENAKKLTARLNLPSANTQQPVILQSEAKRLSDGAYVASFEIPEQISQQPATLEINCQESRKLIFRDEAKTGRSVALLVLPPPAIVYAGDWLNIRIAAVCRKTGQGIFKIPVRVKFTIPGGHQTVNRVIHTDIDGTAIFSTHINSSAAGGHYSCEFFCGMETVRVNLNIKGITAKHQQRVKLLQNRNLSPISTMLKSGKNPAEAQQYYFASPLSQQTNSEGLNAVTLEKGQIFLNYNCPDSVWRQIEVWQNGRIHYSSDLQLASGRISVSFRTPLQSNMPVKLKLWYLNDNGIKIYEQTFYQAGEHQTPISMFFKEADSLIAENGSTILARQALVTKGLLTSNQGSRIRINQADRLPEQIIESVPQPVTEFIVIQETPARLLESDVRRMADKRFFLVDTELQLSRYKFSNIRIWHNPRRFFGSLVGSLMAERSNIAFLIGEAEARTLRLPYMSLAARSVELEKLEGLLAPLCEFFEFCQDKPELLDAWQPGILRATSRLAECIFIPDKLAKAVKAHKIDTTRIGPFTPVLPFELPLAELLPALKSGGKVILVSGDRQMPINLAGDVSIFSSKSFSGKKERFEKLLNTRAIPVVVELDFSGSRDN
ncbi:MAG: hypothetical protein KKB51_12085 [Candidatus Riflebacteria bacterium]|nr:hypothetical protein [Candidatus Riflebacteria bacterium]